MSNTPRATESIAKANLIAAAPELLAHAEADIAELKYYVDNPSAWDSYDDLMSKRLEIVIHRAEAAIAKVTGEHKDAGTDAA
jgi:hypothetical protein